jgi:hypothetical protein
MKFFHNGTIGKIIVIGFAVAIHGLFAAGAYYLGLFLGSIIFRESGALMQQSFAIFYAAIVFSGAMWAFIYSEYAHEDMKAYARMMGYPHYQGYLYAVMLAVAGSELASVLYRVYSTPDWLGRTVIAAIGIFALIIAFCLGKVIHAMANRPFETSILRARESAARSIVDDAARHVDRMTVEQKRRFYTGDLTAIEEAKQSKSDREREKLHIKESKHETRRERREREKQNAAVGKQYASRILGDPVEAELFITAQNKADSLSQNGHQNGYRN